MGSVEEILEILNGAKSDTQMLLGLSCVPKFINIKAREKTEGDWEKKLFSGVARTVPLDFFQRLISSDSTPSDCPPFMYKSVAFSVLSAILVYVEREDQLAQFCHLVCEGLTSLMDLYRENHIEQEDFNSFVLTVKDGMSCCRFLSPQMSVDQLEMEITKLISVGRTVTKIPQLTAESIDLLHGLVELSLKKSIGIRNSREFDEYVHNIVINMKADRTEAVMESFRHLSSVLTADLQSIYCRGITEVPVWIEDLLNLTFGIIQSRLKHPVKQVAICMADSLIELFGLKCFYSHPSYFQLLVSITTVELKLLLEEVTEKQATTNQKELLFSCSSILELAVKFLSDETCGSLAMSDSQLNQTNEIVLEAVKMVGEFLVTWANQLHCAKDEVLNPQLIPPLYRFLCTFLSDDCTLLLQELKVRTEIKMLQLYDN